MSEQEEVPPEEFDLPAIKNSGMKKRVADSKPKKVIPPPVKKPSPLEVMMEQLRKQNESKTAAVSVKPPEKDQPHDSAYTHSALKEKHTLGVLPTLNTDDKGKSTAIIMAALLIMSFFSAWGVAYEVQLAVTTHTPGICPAPAVIEKGGCFTVETATNANGATVTTLIPAGTLGG